jgi:hypothetical protein
MGFDPADPAPRIQLVQRRLLSDNGGQAFAEPETRLEAQLNEVGVKTAGVGGHAEIGGTRQTQPASHSSALHCGNQRDGQSEKSDRGTIKVNRSHRSVCGILGAEIRSGTKVFAF